MRRNNNFGAIIARAFACRILFVMPSLLLSLAFRRFSQFAASGLCYFLVRVIPFRIGIFFLFCCQFLALETRLQDFLPCLLNLLCTIPLLVVLVISPMKTTCDLKSSKTLFLSYGAASVGVVLYQISNTGRGGQIKPPISWLSKSKLN